MQSNQITKIEVQKKRKNRCSIYLDDEFAFGINIDVLYKFGLKKGDQLSEEDIEKILAVEEKQTAKERALKFLSYRDRSEKEVIDKLKAIGYKETVINWVLAELKRLKLIDDTQFAVSFAKTKMINKPMGEYMLRRELFSKGIDEKDIDEAIAIVYQEKDPITLATEVALKQVKKYKHLDETKAKRRVSDFLLRRGFSWDVISDIIGNLDVG